MRKQLTPLSELRVDSAFTNSLSCFYGVDPAGRAKVFIIYGEQLKGPAKRVSPPVWPSPPLGRKSWLAQGGSGRPVSLLPTARIACVAGGIV